MRINDGRVLPAFMGQALRGEDLTVFGDGNQTRSFCYVDDLVESICRLLLSDCADSVNVGNPHEITIGQFAEEIIMLTGTDQKSFTSRCQRMIQNNVSPISPKPKRFWAGNRRWIVR
jgi:dTDP-glucose 4,6-dehydratase